MATKTNSVQQKVPIDVRQKSPHARGNYLILNDTQFWKRDIKNNDFLYLYRRGGAARKVIDKPVQEMFKIPVETDNETANALINEFGMHSIAKYALKNAYISGKVLIFVDWGDEDLLTPANKNGKPVGFMVIPEAWVQEDVLIKKSRMLSRGEQSKQGYNTYTLYDIQGKTFEVHESRFIRYSRDPDEASIYEAAYNAFSVADSALWSVGQALYRYGTGFPHLKITNPVADADGAGTNEIDYVQNQGALLDLSTETGMVSDDRYEIVFAGAGGVALRPREYWDIIIENCAMAADIPKDIFVGLSAGAISGSEVNLIEYHSILRARQTHEIEPLYNCMLELFSIDVKSLEYLWQPIMNRTDKETSDQLKQDAESFNLLLQNNLVSIEEARSYLDMKYDDIPIEEATTSALVQQAESRRQEMANLRAFAQQNQQNQQNANDPQNQEPTNTDAMVKDHLNIDYVKSFYNITDQEIKDSLDEALGEPSAQSKGIQRVEKGFMSEIKKRFNQARKNVTGLFTAFNTD